MAYKNKPLHGLNGSNKTLQLWEIQRHMRRHSSVVEQASPSNETTQPHKPFVMKKHTHSGKMNEDEISRENEKLLRKIRDYHLTGSADTKRRLDEHTRILNLKASARNNALRHREEEDQHLNDKLRDKVDNAKTSYDTAHFNEEYCERKKRSDLMSKSKRNTAESFINTSGSGRGAGMRNTSSSGYARATGLGSRGGSRDLSRTGKSCPNFRTDEVGTSLKAQQLRHESDDMYVLEEQLLSGCCSSGPGGVDMSYREAFAVAAGGQIPLATATTGNSSSPTLSLLRPRSSPGVRRPEHSKEPSLDGKKRMGSGQRLHPSSEMLRSLTEERLRDIERIERVLKGLTANVIDEEQQQGHLQLPQRLFEGSSNIPKLSMVSSSKGNLSDLSGDDQEVVQSITPTLGMTPNGHPQCLVPKAEGEPTAEVGMPTKKLSAAMFNPLMKLKLKAMRIRKINAYMSSLESGLQEEEEAAYIAATATATASEPPITLERVDNWQCLLPSSAMWTLKLRRQRIRKINKYLSDLQSSVGGGADHGGSSEEDLTKEELLELDRILSDMPDTDATTATTINTTVSQDNNGEYSNSAGGYKTNTQHPVNSNINTINTDSGHNINSYSEPVVPTVHMSLGYGRSSSGGNGSGSSVGGINSTTTDTTSENNDMYIINHKTYTEFGLPYDLSMLPPERDDSAFVSCTYTYPRQSIDNNESADAGENGGVNSSNSSSSSTGGVPRDVYRQGVPRCTVLTECNVECSVEGSTLEPIHIHTYTQSQGEMNAECVDEPSALVNEMTAVTSQQFVMRISDVGLTYPKELLNTTPNNESGKRPHKQQNQQSPYAYNNSKGGSYTATRSDGSRNGSGSSEKVLTSTGVLVELLGPACMQTMVGKSKRAPWDKGVGGTGITSSPYGKNKGNLRGISSSKETQRSSFSPTNKPAGAMPRACSPMRENAHQRATDSMRSYPRSSAADVGGGGGNNSSDTEDGTLVVISRHFLSIPQLHAMSGCDFSSSLHKKLGKLGVFDKPTCVNKHSNSPGYGYDAINLPMFGSPGLLYGCLATYLDAMGKGLLLEMILSSCVPTAAAIDTSIHPPIGLGPVQYLNSAPGRAAGVAIKNTIVMQNNDQLRIGIFLKHS